MSENDNEPVNGEDNTLRPSILSEDTRSAHKRS